MRAVLCMASTQRPVSTKAHVRHRSTLSFSTHRVTASNCVSASATLLGHVGLFGCYEWLWVTSEQPQFPSGLHLHSLITATSKDGKQDKPEGVS